MHTPSRTRDRGAILPLVLVIAVVLSVVILALARFVAADLRYAQVTEERAERQASATSAITYGVERIRLGQTLCATGASDFGEITPGIIDNNETTVELTCSRFTSGLSDITGWAIVMTGEGIATDLLSVQGGGTKTVTGPMFIADVDAVTFAGVGTALDHADGDLWHTRGACPGTPPSLPGTYNFVPVGTRGPICTTSTWDQVVGPPAVPDLTVLPVNDGTAYATLGSCRVFSPGHYTGSPDLGSDDAYFQSGSYWFDDIGLWEVKQQTVWFGHPGALARSEDLTNPDCIAARDTDPNGGGVGAVAYFGGSSALDSNTQGAMELFPRFVDGRPLSFQELESGSGYAASTVTAASGSEIIRVAPGSVANMVFRGQVYTPNGWFGFDNSSNTAKQKLLGGATVARMSIQASASATGFEISVATTPFESDLVLTATATSDVSGAATVVRAVIQYRVDESDPNQRVALNSLRVVDS
jgi:Tfp pilus assembly protein PilV